MKGYRMSIADAIDQLDRLQNPEPWEPEITPAAWEALEMGKSGNNYKGERKGERE